MSRGGTRWARPVVGALIVAVLVWRVGAAPFVQGVRSIGPTSVAVALAVGLVTTVAAAWRWRVVARGLGVDIPLGPAVSAYYRSQLLNNTLPGGVLGDVERGYRHGRAAGTMGLALRSVLWERVVGQVVQLVGTAAVLLVVPSPLRAVMPVLVAVLVVVIGVVLVAAVLAARSWRPGRDGLRPLRIAVADIRVALLSRGAWPRVLVASVVVVTGHVAVFVVAASAAGKAAPSPTLVALALVVLAAAAVPTNIAGWGPREGAAAAVFAAAGLGADAGVAASAAYGVLVLVAALPGVVLVVLGRRATAAPMPVLARRVASDA